MNYIILYYIMSYLLYSLYLKGQSKDYAKSAIGKVLLYLTKDH